MHRVPEYRIQGDGDWSRLVRNSGSWDSAGFPFQQLEAPFIVILRLIERQSAGYYSGMVGIVNYGEANKSDG
jgi:hypothetical protein